MTGLSTFEVTKDSRRRLAAVKAKGGIIAFTVVLGAGVSRTGAHIQQVQAQGRRATASWGCPRGVVTPACGRVAGMWRHVHLVVGLRIRGGGSALMALSAPLGKERPGVLVGAEGEAVTEPC